jgi:hypothetical protein
VVTPAAARRDDTGAPNHHVRLKEDLGGVRDRLVPPMGGARSRSIRPGRQGRYASETETPDFWHVDADMQALG